jgi:DNA-binding response OmpR family regulator
VKTEQKIHSVLVVDRQKKPIAGGDDQPTKYTHSRLGNDLLSNFVVDVRPHLPALIDAGLDVRAVNQESFSLDKFQRRVPSVVILDMSLSIREATEVCTAIKSHETGRGIPILMLLERKSDYSPAKASAHSPDHLLVIPFRITELVAWINLLLPPVSLLSGDTYDHGWHEYEEERSEVSWLDPFR